MNDHINNTYIIKNHQATQLGHRPALTHVNSSRHKTRIINELRNAGVSRYGLMRSESRYLPDVIHPAEHIGGVVYGYQHDSFVMLIATDRRIIFLDRKPLFVNKDEITYGVVSGVKISYVGIGSTVTLHTRVKDFTIHTFNKVCALRFVDFIESRCLEHEYSEDESSKQLLL